MSEEKEVLERIEKLLEEMLKEQKKAKEVAFYDYSQWSDKD